MTCCGLLTLVLAGCIYSFSPGGKSDISTIAVAQFENKTIESGLANRMTDLVVDAFISDGNLEVSSISAADAVLNGILTNYKREAYTYDEADNVSQYVVRMTVDVILEAGETGDTLWTETFFSEGVYTADTESEDEGQVRAANKLVVDVINRTTKSW